MTMINFDESKKILEDIQKQFKSMEEVPERIRNIANQVESAGEKNLLNDVSAEFQKALKDAEKGKPSDFRDLLNRAENLANGYRS
jgi:hypothetical protein